LIALDVLKPVKIIQNNEEAEKMILQQGFDRTPEERIAWLLKQIKIMNRLNSTKKKPKGFELKRIKKSKEE
jgi:hypothetical protein